MKLLVFLFSLFFISGITVAQKTIVNGTAPGAERRVIRISTPGDLITFIEKPLATSVVDSTGHFSVPLDIEKTIYATLSIDFHKTELFLEPGKTYDLRIGPMKYDEYTEVNPFIESQNLSLATGDTSTHELNAVIGAFNTIYSAFLSSNFHALYYERNKTLVDTFRVRLNQHFGSVRNTYFNNYASYKLAALEQLTQYYNKSQLVKKYFNDKPVLYNNLEYMDFFNSYFSKYLTVTSLILHKVDYIPVLKGVDPYAALIKIMATDTLLKNEQLRELVLLKGMMEFYNLPAYSKDEVLTVLKSAADRTKFPENKIVATDMIGFLTKLKPGTKAPDFTLLGRDQKPLSLKSLRGKPVVLSFWTTYCQGCLAEMDLIKPLYDKYSDKVQFVSVSADKYFSKMLFFINLKKDYVWTFLNIGDQSEVLKDYDVRGYPLFVMIDKEGKIYKYPAAQPSNGLETDLQKMIQE